MPIVGFSELCWKYKCHNEQVTVHKLTLNSIADRLSELARKKTRVESKLEQYTDKMDQLTHRIVKVLVGQMVILNAGMALRPEEETIKNQLEILYNDINSPLRFQVCKKYPYMYIIPICCSNLFTYLNYGFKGKVN